MPLSTRTYDILLDMPGGVLTNPLKLKQAIEAPGNGITTKLNALTTTGNVLTITFDDTLSAGELTVLDGDAGEPYSTHPAGGLLAAHDDSPSPATADLVEVTNDPDVVIKQERNTLGHYKILPLLLAAVPAGQTRYVDRVIPAYTRGLDWLSALFDGGDQVETGDLVCSGKLIIGQVAQVAADAAQGDTTITIAGPASVLKCTSGGGALSEGFSLSFGTENTTDAGLNAGPPTATGTRSWSNPDQELKEYEIKRFSAATDIGGGNVMRTITLFTPLDAAVTAGTAANMVMSAIPEPLTMLKGEVLDVGGQAFVAGPMPAGTRLRAGFRNNGASAKTVCGKFFVMFGGS